MNTLNDIRDVIMMIQGQLDNWGIALEQLQTLVEFVDVILSKIINLRDVKVKYKTYKFLLVHMYRLKQWLHNSEYIIAWQHLEVYKCCIDIFTHDDQKYIKFSDIYLRKLYTLDAHLYANITLFEMNSAIDFDQPCDINRIVKKVHCASIKLWISRMRQAFKSHNQRFDNSQHQLWKQPQQTTLPVPSSPNIKIINILPNDTPTS